MSGRAVSLVLCLVLSSPVGSVAAAESEPYAVGDVMTGISLRDQHDEPGAVDETTRIVVFSRDMDGGELLEEALADVPEGFLAERRIVYVSDISGMPSLVARLFAVPSMRKRPYPMLLDRTGESTERLPDVEERATVIHLDALRVERIDHAGSVEAVRELVGLAGSDPPQ